MAYMNRVQSYGAIQTAAASGASALLVASNGARLGLSLYAQGNPVYIGFSNPVTAANAAVRIPAEGYWEPPVNYVGPVYAFAPVAGTVTATEYV